MAFGQQLGPPATQRQLQELLSLVQQAGYSDFREARHPLGFTQRQAGGRFSRDEADALIDRLSDPSTDGVVAPPTLSPKARANQQLLGVLSAEQLAEELERRGWIVIAPLAPDPGAAPADR